MSPHVLIVLGILEALVALQFVWVGRYPMAVVWTAYSVACFAFAWEAI